MHPIIIFVCGFVCGVLFAIEVYRHMKEHGYKSYYDEFLQNMAALTEDQFEKVLQTFRDFRKMSEKKDEKN